MNKLHFILMLLTTSLLSLSVHAGGIALGGTRIIYPQASHQVEVSVRNTSENSPFLVQSWVEDKSGNKVTSFFVTPPLYVSAPGNENKLRLIYSGQKLPTDRESLFYFNSKAVPSVNKSSTENKNVLVIAATTRIKLFVRPEGLKPSAEKAPEQLQFSRSGEQVTIINPTPYYITIGELKIGGVTVKDSLMIPPKDRLTKKIAGTSGSISVRTINDYGAYTQPMDFTFH